MCTCQSGQCVCHKVREIIAAQDKVAEQNLGNGCTTSCDRSIESLLAPATGGNPPRNTTIPFILYCKGDCKPFFGTGVTQESRTSGGYNFDCIESPVFRAKKFIDGKGCCVQLELLEAVYYSGATSTDEETNELTTSSDQSVCDYLNYKRYLRSTGVCITIDLNQFFGITCLDPITPLPIS